MLKGKCARRRAGRRRDFKKNFNSIFFCIRAQKASIFLAFMYQIYFSPQTRQAHKVPRKFIMRPIWLGARANVAALV